MRPAIDTDPSVDISGLLKDECFLCGHAVTDASNYGRWGPEGPQLLTVTLPCHLTCVSGRIPSDVANEYHRRIHDLAGVRRMN